MATIDTYKLKIDVEGADKVEDLKDSLQDVGSAFQKAAAAGAAAFSALGVSAIRLADDLVDLADATGISAGKIYQLSAATEAAGGKFESGGKMLQAFSRELEGIEKGSESTIEGLQKLGLSRDQIQNLDDQQLFNAVVNGLANMDNGFQKTALAMQFFGKEAASIDFKTLAQELNKTVDPNLDARLRSAADAVRSIEEAYRNLQLAALEAFAPVISAIGKLNFDIESARKTIQILGALIAGAFAASVVVQIAKVVDLIKKLAQAIRAAGTAQAFLTGLTGVGLIAVGASAAAATAAYVALGKAMEDAVDTKKELEGGEIATPGAQTPQGPQRQIGQTPAEKQLDAVKATTVELEKQNRAALEYERVINGTIGLSQEIAEIKRIDAQLEQDRARSAANYEKQIQVLKADTSKNNQAQIAELQKQQKLADEQLVAMAALKKEAVDRNLAERQNSIELQKQLGLIQERAQANVAAVEAEQMRKVIAGEITQKEADNIVAVNRIREQGLAKIDQLEKQIASEKDTVRKQDLQNQLDATRRTTDFAISEKQREIEEKKALEESYAAGAVKALESIAEAFKPYRMAQDAIQKTWGRIGDAVDKFVETGKFKFSDFARSVLQDLAKMIAKAMIFKAISAALGAIGISIPGLAKGGKATEGQPYIVGEKGPELFVPGETGTVVPTDKLKELLKPLQDQIISEDVARNIAMINQQMSTMANDTSAVVAKPKPIDSMPKLFAPKAPDTIIPNKLPEPTIVESEDKMLNAPITNNYNTYNINALDAKSVAQLFAENRKAIFGANKMAEREMSYAGVR